MIKIEKGLAPESITRAKARENLKNCALYTANPARYDTGKDTFPFTDAYKSAAVKTALTLAQHGKCCFSEAKFVNDDAHVEHFRPKGRVDSWPKGPSTYPGYYWLAYDWDNLFLCKSTTNSSMKKNFFPLRGQILRNRNHLDNRIETSVIIDPSKEDPRLSIRFVKEEIKGINLRGKNNIEILGLRNPQLDEARRSLHRKLEQLMTAVDLLIESGYAPDHPQIRDMIATLKQAVLPQAEFSSMAIDLLTGWPHLA